MKKKMMVLLTVAALMTGLCACGDSTADDENTSVGVSGGQETGSANGEENESASVSSGEVTLEALMAHEVTPAEDFEYETRPETIKITSYLGTDNIVVIPEEIDGMPVSEVSYTTFSEGNGLNVEGVRYGDNIEIIGKFAFSGIMGTNESIKYIILGENVKTISALAFGSCPKLEYVQLNDKLETIDANAFGTSPSITDITLPDGLRDYTAISAFSGMNVHVSAGSEAEAYLNEIDENGDEYGNDLAYWNITVIVE